MQVEDWVARAGPEIAHVAADALMTTAMKSLHHSRCVAEVDQPVEVGDVGAAEERAHVVRGQSRFYNPGTEITAQTMRLVVQLVRVVKSLRVEIRAERTKRNCDICKWARNYAPSTSASKNYSHYCREARKRGNFADIVVRYRDTVAGHAAIRPIKERRSFNVVRIQRPVPVAG